MRLYKLTEIGSARLNPRTITKKKFIVFIDSIVSINFIKQKNMKATKTILFTLVFRVLHLVSRVSHLMSRVLCLASRISCLATIILCASCIDLKAQDYTSPKREFRGAWLSTVWAIDWPNSRDNTTAAEESQKKQMIEILDRYQKANMNVCFFQVRGFSDAFYNSAYEPWSKYLCGERGKEPNYDPFQFVIEECHKRGIECHAWINPYRYSTSQDTYGTLPTDYSNTHPEWLLDCGGTVILNPGMPEVRQRIVDVVIDILSKYDVDGIVFDDYFYPNGGMTDAKDQAQYDAYNPDNLERGDWRRHQVNLMVKDVHDAIKARKPWVRFGISPAGVACTSKSVANKYGVVPCPSGSDWQYNGIYSDPVAWISQNTIDYISPQVYWTIGSNADYSKIVPWWGTVVHKFGRHNYTSCSLSDLKREPSSAPVHAPQSEEYSDVEEYAEDRVFARIPERQDVMMRVFYPQETVNEIVINRESAKEGAPGMVFFSTNKLSTYGFIDKLTSTVYSQYALPPAVTWYKAEDQAMVTNLALNGQTLTWNDDITLRYGIYAIPKAERNNPLALTTAKYLVGMAYDTLYELPEGISSDTHAIAVTVIDGYANEFAPRFLGEELKADVTPQLIAPLDEANIILPTWLTWQPIIDAMSYTLELSYDNDFDSILATVQTDFAAFLTQQIAKIDGSHKTYWRVKANVANANSNWSETRSFTGNLFSVTYPIDGQSEIPTTPTIEWDNAGDATTYTCEVATANTFSSIDIVFSETTTETFAIIPDNVLKYGKNYYVRVKAVSPTVNVISATTLFTTADVVMVAPTILSPSSGDVISAPTLKIVVAETPNNGFRFEVSAKETFPGRATKIKATEIGVYSVEYSNLESGEYYIRVATIESDAGHTDFSTPIKINYTYSNVDVNINNTQVHNTYIIDNILYAPADKHYTIYTIAGAAIATGITTETTQLPNLANGIYMIEVGNTTLKHVVKH